MKIAQLTSDHDRFDDADYSLVNNLTSDYDSHRERIGAYHSPTA